ncbi:MAG: sigma-54 dependent transcriptional regulator [Verrucomicrobiae bacterium]|nr:sigma-54 dependent transcriptional regulator [Verrucomicrobiae bacterium]PAW85660.1 MAG: transcriptional regulator [Opitutae bacterium Tous-C2FEB]
MKPTVLIVDDEKHTRDGLRAALEDKYETFVAKDAAEAARLMQDVPPDAVLTDLRMAGEDGMAVIDRALKLSPQPVCLMMTAYGDVETAVQAMSRGAYWFMQKPVDLRQVELLLERGLKARATEKEVAVLKTRLDRKFSLGEVVGSSAALQHAIEQVRSVATSNATVLLLGETGTGKELFAQMIHQASNRAKGPFMAVHCAAIPANLLESELFGHEKGSFTGANERRVGRFESADGGTLFLDEIGEIDATTQIKLLRFLETRSVERLGSHKPIALDLRLVCATNRDLLQMVKEGKFREDLYYRLSVVPLRMPPLRERPDDIPLLLAHYLKRFAAENHLAEVRLGADALGVLARYPWPGNIRELRNTCENLAVLRPGKVLTAGDLDPRYAQPTNLGGMVRPGLLAASGGMFDKEQNEKELLKQALASAAGNRTKAAELLGISRRTLHRKLLQWPELEVGQPPHA